MMSAANDTLESAWKALFADLSRLEPNGAPVMMNDKPCRGPCPSQPAGMRGDTRREGNEK